MSIPHRAFPPLLLSIGVLLGLGFSQVSAQTQDTLRGRVVNGSDGGEAPAGLEVVLRYAAQDDQVGEIRTVTGPDGEFIFSGLPSQDVLGYVLEARYQGVPYVFQLAPPAAAEAVQLTVYEQTSSTDVLQVRDYTLAITGADSDGRTLQVLEAVQVENVVDRTFISRPEESGPMSLLRFSLPPDAANLDVEALLPGGHVVQVDRGFALTTPVPPGKHDILFTYVASYKGGTWLYPHTFPFGTDVFRVLVLDGLGEATGPGLVDLGPVTIGDLAYRMLEAREVDPGERIEVRVGGLPQPSFWQQVKSKLGADGFQRAVVPVFTAVLLVGVLGYVLVRRRGGVGATSSGALSFTTNLETREEVAAVIAQLDDSFTQGQMGEADYRLSREGLKERWRELGSSEYGPAHTGDPSRQQQGMR